MRHSPRKDFFSPFLGFSSTNCLSAGGVASGPSIPALVTSRIRTASLMLVHMANSSRGVLWFPIRLNPWLLGLTLDARAIGHQLSCLDMTLIAQVSFTVAFARADTLRTQVCGSRPEKRITTSVYGWRLKLTSLSPK